MPAPLSPENPTPAVIRPRVIPPSAFGISVFESRHAPGFEGTLRDNFSKFFLVLAGKAVWEAGHQRALLEANSFVHIPAGVEHRQTDLKGNAVTLYAIHYVPGLLLPNLHARLESLGLAHWGFSDANEGLTRFLRSSFQEMLFEQHLQREGWESVLCARLLEMAARSVRLLLRHGDAPPDGVAHPKHWDVAERMAHYVSRQQTRFYRQETLDEAARSVGVSRRQFTSLFREVAGVSWLEHRTSLRLNHAVSLLRHSEQSIVAIAFEAGFEDLSNFHRAFKKAFGCAPKTYREQARNTHEEGA